MKVLPFFQIIIACWLSILLVGCQEYNQVPTSPEWKASQVRLIDEIDSSDPDLELVALYTRQVGEELHIRLDFLDLAEFPDGNIYLAFDHAPGGMELPEAVPCSSEAVNPRPVWDFYLEIPASGAFSAYGAAQPGMPGWQPLHGAAIRLVRNPQLDTIEISLSRDSLDPFVPNTRLLAWIIPQDSQACADQVGPVLWNEIAPTPLRVLFAFNHVFPAFTPSQGLRRWDGAHTGPEGGRHGLYNLLRPARNYGVPLLLLDLASPTGLSALDYQGGLELVRSLAESGAITLASPLPESTHPLPAAVNEYFLDENAASLAAFDLPGTALIFQPVLEKTVDMDSKSIPLKYSREKPVIHAYPVGWRSEGVWIHLPAWPGTAEPQQVSASGLTLAWKELMVQSALNHQGDGYMVLGGSLPQSAWGQPASARAGLEYIDAHPWISVASPSEVQPGSVLYAPSWSPAMSFTEAELAPEDLLRDLLTAPMNSITRSAWLAYRASFAPVFPPSSQLPLLRQEYLGVVRRLLEAARWMEDRSSAASCDSDLDGDGQAECILANDRTLAFFDPEGGTLTHLFLACPGSLTSTAYQVIGPSSQLITGLSDPMDWQLEARGSEPADPGVFAGALAGPQGQQKATITPDELGFTSVDGQISKRYQLAPEGLHVEIRSQFPTQLPKSLVVPVLIEPAASMLPGRLNQAQSLQGPAEIQWPISEQALFVIHTLSPFEVTSFLDSRDFLSRTEDPNFAYPRGHTLPFPLALVEIRPEGNLFLDFRLRCEE